ncbi:MAG: class I SAM-dependent methyltransferase [Rhodospirillaceae bacterium]|nr:class I SAM-dependent methyltransferase [Rhodospirillaceae bacterium]
MNDAVAEQYEAYPYPPRDPRDEKKRLIAGSPSHLAEINHYVFGGRLDFTRPFRALIAGGGTGDGAIMLAQQLADAACPAEIVYLDRSAAARRIAEARAQARGLGNLRFVTGSLFDVQSLGLGVFDYVDCCGVLHHLGEPRDGLKALVGGLSPRGGMGLMVYGRLGRTGVYPAQAMLRALSASTDTLADRIAAARRLLAQLPPTNWLRRNPGVADHVTQSDAGIVDLLLHARDRAYTVPELAALIAEAGLRIAGFIEPALYEPATYLNDPELRRRLAPLDLVERAAFAENLAGNLKTHVVYAVAHANPVAPPSPDAPSTVPVPREGDFAGWAGDFQPGGALTTRIGDLTLRFPLPRLAAAIAARIDGRRTLRDIFADLTEAQAGRLDWAGFAGQFVQLYAALNGLNKLLLAAGPAAPGDG